MTNDTVESLTRIKRLAAATCTISESLDFEEALRRIAESGHQLVGSASCLVLLRDGEDYLRIHAAQGVHPSAAERFVGSMEESVLGKLQLCLGLEGSRGTAAFPIVSDQIVRGLLVVIRSAPLDAEETRLMSALADQAAVTLANAHHHETLASRQRKLQGEVERSRKAIRELEGMIGSVARDLQAPLRNLAEGGDRLSSGARKVKSSIQDLLAYSRLAGAELSLEPVDLEEAVEEARVQVEAELRPRMGLVRVESPLFKALAHRETLVKILGNLLLNGADIVRAGEPPRLEVTSELLGDWVRVSVVSNGAGIGEARLDQEFGESGRLEREGDRPGSRIGLAVVLRGVERMGGRCGVESMAGKGSRSWIELRAAP